MTSQVSSTLTRGTNQLPNHGSPRARRAVERMNRDIADPTHGASEKEISIAQPEPLAEGEIPPESFVGQIIANNQSYYDRMLQNQFCKDMAKASSKEEKEKVLKGYKWYTVQDFMYCENLIRYDAARASNAPTSKDVLDEAAHVHDSYTFALSVLDICTNDLEIPRDKVCQAKKSAAMKDYGSFEVSTAQDEDWFTSKIAMIPCIQGYYRIAKTLEDTTVDKNTVWYHTWVEANRDWESCEKQINFFEANKPPFEFIPPETEEKWNRIFREACAHEVDFFALGENPEEI